jgi:hypothetical protein
MKSALWILVLWVLVLMGLAALSSAQQAHVSPHQDSIHQGMIVRYGVTTGIPFRWKDSNAACPEKKPTRCITGFYLTDVTAGEVIATPRQLGSRTRFFNWEPVGGLYTGTHTFSLYAVGFDDSGNPTQSPSATEAITNE